MVAVGYEQARGLREKNQTSRGYAVSASRTYPAPVAKVFGCWNDPKRRFRWLEEENITVRKATPGRSMRIAWKDGESRVDVSFYEKGAAKAQVTVDHNSLARRRDVERMKVFWTKQLDRLTEFLKP
jgi:uncharacterized protein YndB with AHSA1/START domain